MLIIRDLFQNDNKPYLIIKGGFKKYLSEFLTIFSESLLAFDKNESCRLENLHDEVSINELNPLRIAIFKELNKIVELYGIMSNQAIDKKKVDDLF